MIMTFVREIFQKYPKKRAALFLTYLKTVIFLHEEVCHMTYSENSSLHRSLHPRVCAQKTNTLSTLFPLGEGATFLKGTSSQKTDLFFSKSGELRYVFRTAMTKYSASFIMHASKKSFKN